MLTENLRFVFSTNCLFLFTISFCVSNKPLKQLDDDFLYPRIISWSEIEQRFRKDEQKYEQLLEKIRPTVASDTSSPVIPTPPSSSGDQQEELEVVASPPSYQEYHSRGKACVVELNGKKISCYQKTKLFRIKLEELKKEAIISPTNYLLYDRSFNSCHQAKHAIAPKTNESRLHNEKKSTLEVGNNQPYVYKDNMSNEHITGHCITSSYTLLRPYYLPNIDGELRFIVQDPEEDVNQCQPRAVCSLTPESYLHLQKNCDPKSVGTRFHCERKTCNHQLLAWDPLDPKRGPFIEMFEFECCCRCRMETLYPVSLMKFTLFVIAFLMVKVYAEQKTIKNVQYEPGFIYEYKYTSRLLAGIPKLASIYAGFELKADLILQPKTSRNVLMKLNNIEFGEINSKVERKSARNIGIVHIINREYQHLLTKSIQFTHEDGVIKSFIADAAETNWSLNIKKAILSLFYVNLTPQKIMRDARGNLVPRPISYEDLTYYGVYEKGVAGVCETVYEVKRVPYSSSSLAEKSFVLNVTKTRDFGNCITEPNVVNENFDIRGCLQFCNLQSPLSIVSGYYPIPQPVKDPYMKHCPCKKEVNSSPIDQFNFVLYNISTNDKSALIEEVASEGKVIYNTYGDKIMIMTHQNVLLVEQRPSRRLIIPAISSPVTHEEFDFRIPLSEIKAGSRRFYDIPFLHLSQPTTNEEQIANIHNIFDQIANSVIAADISIKADISLKIINSLKQLALSSIETLEITYKKIMAKIRLEKVQEKDQLMRKLFLDILPASGTNNAAVFIKRLVEASLVSDFEAKNLIETLPQNMFLPDVSTIDSYLDLCLNHKIKRNLTLYGSICIAFGKLVERGCVRINQNPGDIPIGKDLPQRPLNSEAQVIMRSTFNQHRNEPFEGSESNNWFAIFSHKTCKESDITKYVQNIARQFYESDNFHEKMIYAETLARMNVLQVLSLLSPIVTGQVSENACPGYHVESSALRIEECVFIRVAIIYSLHHLSDRFPKQLESLLIPVFKDKSEPYQVRIAAFSVISAVCVDDTFFESVIHSLITESNNQVRNYVYTALQGTRKLSIPCFKKNTKFSNRKGEVKHGFQYSNVIINDFYNAKHDFGMWSHFEWVANNKSSTPRGVYCSLGASNGPFINKWIEFRMNQKGIEALFEQMLGRNDLVDDLIDEMNRKWQQQRPRRASDSAKLALELLKKRFDFKHRIDENPKMSLLFKLFESGSFYAFDEQQIKSLINHIKSSFGEMAQSLIDGYTGHFIKVLMPASLERLIPSQIGFPVIVSHKHPIVLSLKIERAKLDLITSPKAIYPVGFNFTTFLTPQIIYSSIIDVSSVSSKQGQTYGTYVNSLTKAVLPFEIFVNYKKSKNLLSFSISTKLPQQIFIHKNEAKTYISQSELSFANFKSTNIIKTKPVPYKMEASFGQQFFGVGLRYQLTSENEWPKISFENFKSPGFITQIIELFNNPGLKNSEFHLHVTSDKEVSTYSADFTLGYKWVADEENVSDADDSDESSAFDESDSDNSNESFSESNESKSGEFNGSEIKILNSDSNESQENLDTFIRKLGAFSQKNSRNLSTESSEEYDLESFNSESSNVSSNEKENFDFANITSYILSYGSGSIKEVSKKLIEKTRKYWIWVYDKDFVEDDFIPGIVIHNLIFTAVSHGLKPSYFAAIIRFVHTPQFTINWVKMDIYLKTLLESHTNVINKLYFDFVVSYPQIFGDLSYDPSTTQDVKAKIKSEISWGPKCGNESGVVIDGSFEKNEDQTWRAEHLNGEQKSNHNHVQEWFYRQCENDKSKGIEMSYACELALLEHSQFNRFALNISYRNLLKEIHNISYKLDMAFKKAFYNYLDYGATNTNNLSNQINIAADYSTKISNIPLLNLYLTKPKETIVFKRIYVPNFTPPSIIYSYFDIFPKTYNVYKQTVSSCALMETSVRTFDNVTFTFPESNCQYLVAMDCSPYERWAIFATKLDSFANTKKVTILTGGKELKLMPAQQPESAQITIDGKTKEITTKKHEVFCSVRNCLKVYLHPSKSYFIPPVIVIEDSRNEILIKYDGKKLKVEVSQYYKGKTCGICGDNNGENENEFVGPNLCFCDRVDDFVNSYSLLRENCSKVITQKGKVKCPDRVPGVGSRALQLGKETTSSQDMLFEINLFASPHGH
ncbi:vitellogenin-like protein [Dinothrombium tinctorium]|uniref:Vitellogenin-like protein n=1 Tax=Dinothrombium tinctorium TaxID=1965070 RepID=A0A3S3RY97_9ACAR|nr:vitellogenin-like protein [Dinothrombium tinctorium]RWS07818.1 vitellogenin-like protein [Dinothrombium tinctorium]RWS07819.1 vitellogenin-like protein [Dinothrombium tinctorium]RWS07821.1 vitellogenin-like protein [Dinothrombium tinctorium]RWS08253.1 vitellogenin-like protein [Dinothrombium tinctorium]